MSLPRWSKRVDVVAIHTFVMVRLEDGTELIADRYLSRLKYQDTEWTSYETGEGIPVPVAWRLFTDDEARATLARAEARTEKATP